MLGLITLFSAHIQLDLILHLLVLQGAEPLYPADTSLDQPQFTVQQDSLVGSALAIGMIYQSVSGTFKVEMKLVQACRVFESSVTACGTREV